MPFQAMRHAICSSILVLLTACGGGGESNTTPSNLSTPPANKAPTIALSNIEAQANSSIVLSAQATDSDGTIASYSWSQKSGISVTLSEATAESVSFDLPEIEEKSDIILTLTVTDNDGVGISKDIIVTVLPTSFSITLTGKVETIDTTLANTPVVITIGDKQYETTTNELGQYTIELNNISSQEPNQLLKVSASGKATNSIIKLVSYVGNIQSLLDIEKQNDGSISSTQLPALNVTALSTAAAALAYRDNSQQELTSFNEYHDRLTKVNRDVLIHNAMLIEHVIKNIDNQNELPTTFSQANSNIYDFIKSKDNATALYYEIPVEYFDENNYQSALFQSNSTSALTPTFNANDSSLSLYSTMGHLVLNKNGTGELTNTDIGKKEISWQQTENFLEITLTQTSTNEILTYENTVEYGYIEVQKHIESYRVRSILSGTREILIVLPMSRYKSVDLDTDVTVISNTEYQIHEIFNDNNIINFTDHFTANSTYFIDFEHPNASQFLNSDGIHTPAGIYTLKLSFISSTQVELTVDNVDVNGQFSVEASNASWFISDKGVLQIFNDTWEIQIVGINPLIKERTQTLITAQFHEQDKLFVSHLEGNLYQHIPAQWNSENIIGVYQYIDTEMLIDPQNAGWYELRNDGTLSYFHNFNSLREAHTTNIYESPGLWRIIDNKLVIRRFRQKLNYYNSSDRCHSDAWETDENSECMMYFEREWQLMSTYTENNEYINIIQQNSRFTLDYQGFTTEQESPLLRDVHSLYSPYIKQDTRPIALPENYVLIKDR